MLGTIRFGVELLPPLRDGAVGIRVEARLRELLYHAYLAYPRAFYDRQATGEVVSRATNDLYPIRYFIGWGVVQGAPERDDDRRRGDGARHASTRADARSPRSRCRRSPTRVFFATG